MLDEPRKKPNPDQSRSSSSSSGADDFSRKQFERSKSQERQETNPSGDAHRDLISEVDKDLAAKDSFQKDFGSRKTALGINHPDTIESLYSLVEVHEKLKDFQGIKNLLNENDENALLKDVPATGKTADILHCLGKAYLELRDLNRAAEMFVGELSVRAMAKGLGPDHPTMAKPFDSLSTIYKIEAESKLQEHIFQEALQANKMEENCLRRALDVLTAVRQSLDPSKRSNPQRIQEVNPSDNEDRSYLEKRLDECLKKGSEIKWEYYHHRYVDNYKPEDLKDLTNRYSLEVQTKLPDATDTSRSVSSQKFGADPLVNPGQKRYDESSSATFPQNIEKIPRSELKRSQSGPKEFGSGKLISKPNDPSSSHSADHQELEQPEQVAPSEMTRSTSQGGKQRGLGRFLSHLLGSRREERSLSSRKRASVPSDTASSSRENIEVIPKVLITHNVIFKPVALFQRNVRFKDVLTWKKS